MIVHHTASSPDSCKLLFRGRNLDFWIPLLYADLNRSSGSKPAADDLAVIWSDAALPRFDNFQDWFDRLDLPRLTDRTWLSFPGQCLWITRLANVVPLLRQGRLNSAEFPTGPELHAITPAAAVPLVSDPCEVHRIIAAFQYRHYSEQNVTILDPDSVYIEALPAIGPQTRIHCGTVIEGTTVVAANVCLGPNVHLNNADIGANAVILDGSLIFDSQVAANTQIGPYAHLRAQSSIMDNAKVGNFVEVKNSRLGKGSKAMHLSYLGDATIGERVNIGAGTITCNYDGVNKNPTRIGDDVFIGSGTELVAPVTVEANSFVAAGSTITETVPSQSLAVARCKQRNITGWVQRRSGKTKD